MFCVNNGSIDAAAVKMFVPASAYHLSFVMAISEETVYQSCKLWVCYLVLPTCGLHLDFIEQGWMGD